MYFVLGSSLSPTWPLVFFSDERYPAIDIVWCGHVFLALGFLRHLALRGSAWWSPSPGWCSIQSFSWASVLPFLTLTHALIVYNTPAVVSAVASNPSGEFVTVFSLRSHHCLRFHRPVVSNDEELCGRRVPSPPSHTGTSVSDLRPWCPLARSLHSCLRFHRTVVPMVDVRCSLRLSSHPAVTLRVDESHYMWPLRSSQGVPTAG